MQNTQKRLFEIKENSEENGSTRKEMKIKIWKNNKMTKKQCLKSDKTRKNVFIYEGIAGML